MTTPSVNQPTNAFLPNVSVIIPVYNGEADLPALLACLQAQTYPTERVEYLLVDNGSRDRTFDVIQAAVRESQAQKFPLRYLSETDVQSSYAARNTGIRAASGDILAFTDADCRPQPGWLHYLMKPFADPGVGLVAGEVVALPGTTVLEKFADRRETLSQTHTLAHPFYPYGQTANLAIRKEALAQAGLFRPYLTTGGDADLCWRIQQAGDWKIYFAEQAIVQHRHRGNLAELRRQWQRYGRSNRYLHELHGVQLMREMPPKGYLRRWGRWLLKEVPITVSKVASRKADLASLLDTPLDLLCIQARSQGQRQARLPAPAREIDWLRPPSPEMPPESSVEVTPDPPDSPSQS